MPEHSHERDHAHEARYLKLDISKARHRLGWEPQWRLESALESFDGTAIFVSHDRYFLDRIADRIVEVDGGALLAHEGGYSSWFESKGVSPVATSRLPSRP